MAARPRHRSPRPRRPTGGDRRPHRDAARGRCGGRRRRPRARRGTRPAGHRPLRRRPGAVLEILDAGRSTTRRWPRSPPTTWWGLLLVHGLHPYAVETRVERRSARPALPRLARRRRRAARGGRGGVVRLRLLGSCDGCPSSAVTLQLAVEGAVEDAAPEVTASRSRRRNQSGAGLISRGLAAARWATRAGSTVSTSDRAPGARPAGPGDVAGFAVGGLPVVCRRRSTGSSTATLPHCAGSLAGTALSGTGGRSACAALPAGALRRTTGRAASPVDGRISTRCPPGDGWRGACRPRLGVGMTSRSRLGVLRGSRPTAAAGAASAARCAPSRSGTSTRTWSTSRAGR